MINLTRQEWKKGKRMKNRGRFGVYFTGSVADPRETKKYVFIKRKKSEDESKGRRRKRICKSGGKRGTKQGQNKLEIGSLKLKERTKLHKEDAKEGKGGAKKGLTGAVLWIRNCCQDPDPEFLFQIQQNMKEQINKNVIFL